MGGHVVDGGVRETSWWRSDALSGTWARIAERLERNGIQPQGRLQLQELGRDERHAVGDLLGHSVTTARVTVDLAVLDERLRLRAGVGIAEAAETATGRPLVDRRARRSLDAERRSAPEATVRRWLADHPDVGWSWVHGWLGTLRSDGLLGRDPDPQSLVLTALQVLYHRQEFLQEAEGAGAGGAAGGGPVARSALAASTCHDAHALDDDRRLASVVLRGVAAATSSTLPADARDRRDLWERLGVVTDLVSSTCLVWRLPVRGWDRQGRPRGFDTSEPTHLTWWDIRQGITVAPPGRVLVCENPSVLEAVAGSEPDDLALVCTSGRPNLVTAKVLAVVADTRTALLYHGDFDWPGLSMAADAQARYGARPWRMSAADYESVAGSLPLKGAPVLSPWDPELAAAMRRRGVAVHEEAVLDALLEGVE